jgi:uncharacterized phage-associated protein
MKLHDLLYFTQRESFVILGDPAFEENFEGWKFGPISREVRNNFIDGEIIVPTEPISDEAQYIASNVIMGYGSLALWRLSELSRREISWNNARKGLAPEENGSRIIALSDIQEDAKKVRPYDHIWDMYYDEFDDDGVTMAVP